MKSSFRLVCVIVAAGVFASVSAMAKMDEFGHGPRAISMGQAQVANSADYSALFYNSAALIQARDAWGLGVLEPLVTLGSAGTKPELYLNGVNQAERYSPNVQIGILLPLMKRLVLGLEVFLSTDELLDIEMFYGPQIERYRVDHTFGLCEGIGFQVTKKFSVGFTNRGQLAYNASSLNLDIGPILSGILGIDLLQGTSNTNPAFELDVISHNSYAAGALYRPFKWLSLGINYAYRNPSPINIPIKVTLGGLIDDMNLTLIQWGINPTIITGGVALYPVDQLTLTFDLGYALYSLEKKPGMHIESEGESSLFGGGGGWDNVDLKDVYIPKFGVEWKDHLKGKYERVEYAVRAGYQYYPTPYPSMGSKGNQTLTLDPDAHYYTGGLMVGYRPDRGSIIRGPAFIGLEYFYEYIHLVERSHRNIESNPPVISAKGSVLYSGLALTMHW